MIIVQTPLRLSLFGGGTDFPSFFRNEGGCVLSTAIDKYIFVTIKTRFDRMLRVGYTKTEIVDQIDELQHELIREAFRITNVREGVEITTMGDIPAGSGLGSSSTVTVGSLHAMYSYQNKLVSEETLAKQACEIELDILKKPIGVQDQYIASYGGLRFITFSTDGNVNCGDVNISPELKRQLNSNMIMFFTGITRKSETILEEQKQNIKTRLKTLRSLKEIAVEAHKEICAGNIDAFGHLLHESWMLKRQLAKGITNGVIDEWYRTARNAGAIGGKISGAGGGGFLLLYCPCERQDEVRKALHPLIELPFRFVSGGSKVIFDYRS